MILHEYVRLRYVSMGRPDPDDFRAAMRDLFHAEGGREFRDLAWDEKVRDEVTAAAWQEVQKERREIVEGAPERLWREQELGRQDHVGIVSKTDLVYGVLPEIIDRDPVRHAEEAEMNIVPRPDDGERGHYADVIENDQVIAAPQPDEGRDQSFHVQKDQGEVVSPSDSPRVPFAITDEVRGQLSQPGVSGEEKANPSIMYAMRSYRGTWLDFSLPYIHKRLKDATVLDGKRFIEESMRRTANGAKYAIWMGLNIEGRKSNEILGAYLTDRTAQRNMKRAEEIVLAGGRELTNWWRKIRPRELEAR